MASAERLIAAGRRRPAAEAFAALSRQNRYAILFRLGTVTRSSTRARKIDQHAAMLVRGETIYPQKPAAASP